MTISADNIKTLLQSRVQANSDKLESTLSEIEHGKVKLKSLEQYAHKLEFRGTSLREILITIKNDELTDAPFEKIHPCIFENITEE